jgi:hypothetical protein
VKKIDVSSGSVQTVCDVPLPAGAAGPFGTWRAGAWSRHGVIIFGAEGTGLWRVPEAGGAPAELTRLDPKSNVRFHGSPYFLPDGRHFFYPRAVGGIDPGVYLGSLDVRPEQQSEKRLLNGDSSAAYAASTDPGSSIGHILFVHGNSLMAQAFDARRLVLAGEAALIEEGVSVGGPRRFSASMTGALAYQPSGSVGWGGRNRLTWFNREGKPLGTVGERLAPTIAWLCRPMEPASR